MPRHLAAAVYCSPLMSGHLINRPTHHRLFYKNAGEAHLPGVTQQLQSGRLSSGEAQEDVLCGTAPDEGPEQQGVRRALLTSCLALCCPAEVR